MNLIYPVVGICCVHHIDQKDCTVYSWVTRKGYMGDSLYTKVNTPATQAALYRAGSLYLTLWLVLLTNQFRMCVHRSCSTLSVYRSSSYLSVHISSSTLSVHYSSHTLPVHRSCRTLCVYRSSSYLSAVHISSSTLSYL